MEATIRGNHNGILQHLSFLGYTRGNTADGTVWLSISTADTTATIQARTAAFGAGALVASGSATIANPETVVSLSPVASSGLSGNAVLVGATSIADVPVTVFYACDDDLHSYFSSANQLLRNGEFAMEPGFEAAHRVARETLHRWVKQAARISPTTLARPQQLKETASLLALAVAHQALSTEPDDPFAALAREFNHRARQAFLKTPVELITAEIVVPGEHRTGR